MKLVANDGQEYEVVAVGCFKPSTATHFLAPHATLQRAEDVPLQANGTWLRKVPKQYHAFGVVWEETGNKRLASPDEVYVNYFGKVVANQSWENTAHDYPILRPVSVE